MQLELRWYQTFDNYDNESEPVLQYRLTEDGICDEWEDVEFVRERVTYVD